MAHTTNEFTRLQHFLQEFGFQHLNPIPLFCDNKTASHIASNPVFHDITKHIKVNYHFIWDKLLNGDNFTPFVKSGDQLAKMFTKALSGSQVKFVCSKLHLYYMYAPTWGSDKKRILH